MTEAGLAPGEDMRQFAGMELVAFQRRLIGRFLTDPAAIGPSLDAGLDPKHLEDPRCRRAMGLIVEAYAAGDSVGPAEVFARAQKSGKATPELDAWLASVAERPLEQSPKELVPLFVQRWQWWQLDQIGTILQDEAKRRRMTPLELREQLVQKLHSLTPEAKSGHAIGDVIRESFPVWDGTERPDLMKTGIWPLDKLLDGGMEVGDLVLVAAPPGCGKTSLAVSAMVFAAVEQHQPSTYVTMEMPRSKIMRRGVANLAQVSPKDLNKKLTNDNVQSVMNAAALLTDSPITILDEPGWSTASLRSWLQSHHDKKTKLLIIDQFDKMAHPSAGNDTLQRLATSQGLKNLALEFELRIILLSQITKASQSAAARPKMSDIRDAPIYQDADIVILAYRPEYYLPPGDVPEEWEGLIELIVDKNRDGETGIAKAYFDAPTASVRSARPGGY